ncbi:hypothetical protein HID58_062204 [Brassica napus]|uniref:TF-B3 domain-containing protein n=1 Tax=Brassica napus TaxID=3708 RepID=A0ABQ8A0Z5_BRANA|nr:hypothetical protein HID58_062204 [Brassica napus]
MVLLKLRRMANKHFFQPLLPGFHTHLKIPVAFFSKHMEGRNEHKNMAKLRSEASEMTWKVKIEDGRRLTEGWKEFALAHDLRVGDIVVFRQEKDMSFHVTLFGPSCCEIQYGSGIDQDNNLEKIQEKKNPKREEAESSCFVANVRLESDEESNHISSQERIDREDKKGLTSQSRFVTLTIRYWDVKNSRLYLPMAFTKDSGINVKTKLALLDKNDVKWPTDLRSEYNGKRLRMIGGWKKFFKANFLKIGESIKFKLIWDGNTSCVLNAKDVNQ